MSSSEPRPPARRALALSALLAACAPSPSPPASTSGQLTLSASDVAVDEVVRVAAPADVAAGGGAVNGRGGCGFQVEWGDAPSLSAGRRPSCASLLEHKYAAPGTYVVEVTTYEVQPDDSTRTTWRGQAKVTVR